MKWLGTALAGSAWIAVCAYLYAWWPGLAAALGLHVPRTAILALGLATATGLRAKDRWLDTSRALIVDALVAAPPLAAICLFVHPILFPVE